MHRKSAILINQNMEQTQQSEQTEQKTEFDRAYFKELARDILNLDPALDSFWDIMDHEPKNAENPRFILLHYNDNMDPDLRSHAPLKKLRGLIIDVRHGVIVRTVYGYSSEMVVDGPIESINGIFHATGLVKKYFTNDPDEAPKQTIGEISFPPNSVIFAGQEGAVCTWWKHEGVHYFSTHKKILGEASQWSNRRRFIDIYRELGGPEPETFFGDEDSSPYNHHFLIVSNDTKLVATNSEQMVIYLGVQKVWDEEEWANYFKKNQGPFWHFEDIVLRVPALATFDEDKLTVGVGHGAYPQDPLDIVSVNRILFPYEYAAKIPAELAQEMHLRPNELLIQRYPEGQVAQVWVYIDPKHTSVDQRNKGGDFVVVFTTDGFFHEIISPAAAFRREIMARDPNAWHRFVAGAPAFIKNENLSNYPVYYGGDGKPLDLTVEANRLTLWLSLVGDALSPCHQDQVDEFGALYKKEIENVAKFIWQVYRTTEDLEILKVIPQPVKTRMTFLINLAQDIGREKKISPFNLLKGFLTKENGVSFYKMIRVVKKYEEKKQKAVQ